MTDMTLGRRNDDGSVTPWLVAPPAPTSVPQVGLFDPFALVGDFIRIFEASTDMELWEDLVAEETKELLEAMRDHTQPTARLYWGNILKETADLIYVMTGWAITGERQGGDVQMDPVLWDVANDALSNIFLMIGPDTIQEAFLLVHQSNLSKLDASGKPIRREDGKILKGPNYAPPDMGPLAARLYDILNDKETN